MSYILFIAIKAAVAAFSQAYAFNDKRDSQYLPTIAAWPMSPLVVP